MITLAIETAMRGGSLSLMENNREIDFRVGSNSVSKAEDVLERIASVLRDNEVKKIDLIAVATGPGSSTGVRIGLATALGLRKSFKCETVGVSIFEALIFEKDFNETALLAIPVGGRHIAWQVFEKKSSFQANRAQKIQCGNVDVFSNLLKNQDFTEIILHAELTELITSNVKKFEKCEVQIMSGKFARLIGLKAIHTINDSGKNKKNNFLSTMRPIMLKC